MKISRTTAMRIVSELSDIIQQKINMMDENGIIIASTDEVRIGTYHGGSQKILAEHLEKLVIYKDEEREGVRKGVNLPIEVNGQYIGVVGITGEYDEVAKYGHIIKKMTEILILDYERNEHRRMERTARSRFVREWVMNGANPMDETFIRQAAVFGIDYKLPRRMIVFSENQIPLTDPEQNLKHMEWLEQTIARILSREKKHLFFNNGKEYVLLIPENKDAQILKLCEQLQSAVCQEGDSMLYIGIDSENADIYSMREAYARADKARYSAMQTKNARPVFYGDLKLELFIHEIPEKLRQEYIRKLFAGYDTDEIRQLGEILRVLYECNGSIQRAADQLFLHKNTLQYKLNKIAEKTGINPRTMPGAALFYMATEFLKMEYDMF